MLRRDAFRTEISFAAGSWNVALFGELDLATAAEAERAIQVVRSAAGNVTLDLSGLLFMDSSGVQLIGRLSGLVRRGGYDLRVVVGTGPVRRVVEISGIAAFVNVVDTPWPSEGSRLEHAVIATDAGGMVTVWNGQAQRLYGWSALEVLGRSIMEVTVGPEDRRVAEEIMAQVQRMGVWEGEFDVRSKNGTRFSAHVRNSLIEDEHGNVTGFVGLSVKSSELAFTLSRR